MSLLVGLVVLTLAILLGGFAAVFRERARGAMGVLRTFAVVAAAAVALLHVLPEAVAAGGWPVLLAAAVGALGPIALERALPHRDHDHGAPTTALAMGYAAVVAHQAGEGAAIASLADVGALSAGVVLAIAAHTLPLSMVVSIRVLEVRDRRDTALALLGVVGATAAGAFGGTLIGASRLAAARPWLLALVAGLLLHALSHDDLAPPLTTTRARVMDTVAGLVGLSVACLGVEDGEWMDRVPKGARVAAIVVLALGITARSFLARPHAHGEAFHDPRRP